MFSSIVTKGISSLMLPLYTSYIPPDDYGVLDSLYSIIRLMPIFLSLALDQAFARFFHEQKNDEKQLRYLFSSVYWFVLIFGIIVTISALASSSLWMESLLKVKVWPYAYLALITPLFLQIGQLGMVFLRQSLLSRQTTMVEISSTIINVSIAVSLLIGTDFGFASNLLGKLSGAIFLFVFYTIYFSRKGILGFYFNKQLLVKCLKFSIPLVPSLAGIWIAGLSDRLVIAKYIGLRETGLYSTACAIGTMLYFLHDALTQVTGPVSMSGLIYDKEKAKQKIADFSLLLWIVMLTANLSFYLFAKEIIAVLADKLYADAYIVLPIIAFYYVLGSQNRFFTTVISYHKKTVLLMLGSLLNAFLNLALNLIFIPKYGYIVAAYTTVISIAFNSVFLYYWSQKLERINFHWKKNGIVFAVFIIAMVFSSFYLIKDISIGNFVIKSLFLILFIYALVLVSGRMGYIKKIIKRK